MSITECDFIFNFYCFQFQFLKGNKLEFIWILHKDKFLTLHGSFTTCILIFRVLEEINSVFSKKSVVATSK